jgi:hypothetical protein
MAAAILKSEVAQPYHPEVETTEDIFELVYKKSAGLSAWMMSCAAVMMATKITLLPWSSG